SVIRQLAQHGIRIEDDSPAPGPGLQGGMAHDLLSQEEEARLARTTQVGMRLREELQGNSAELSDEVLQLIRSGERARERLISCKRRLVYWVAANYRRSKVDMEDLVQEGMTGLMRAVEKFDPDLGIKFSTYAVWWIRQAITRTIDNTGDLIR